MAGLYDPSQNPMPSRGGQPRLGRLKPFGSEFFPQNPHDGTQGIAPDCLVDDSMTNDRQTRRFLKPFSSFRIWREIIHAIARGQKPAGSGWVMVKAAMGHRPSFDKNGRKAGLKRSSVEPSSEPAPEILNGGAERTGCQPTADGCLQERGVGALEFFLLDQIHH